MKPSYTNGTTIVAGAVILIALALFGSNGSGPSAATNGETLMTDKKLEGDITAPDFPPDLSWLNTDRSYSLKDFRGKIVLLDFWTFCCINCMHVIPDLKRLEEKYPDELVVIGVHSAKFTNEKQTDAIRQAILRYEIKHPVVNDSDFEIWNEYSVRAWPTLVLINPNGRIIGSHSGEGIFEPFDKLIGDAVKYFDAKKELKRGPLKLALETQRQPQLLLSFPGKISADSVSKRLIITDSNHNRLLITDELGAIQDVIGSGLTGATDGSFETSQFDHPQGTYLDGDILYIADTENHTIRSANLTTRTVKTILGTGRQARSFNMGGKGISATLNSPWDVLGHDGRLYIAMAGPHQLWVADLNTLETRPFAGSGMENISDGPLLEASLAQPSGITTDGKKLFFADSETSSIRSADINPAGRVQTIVGHGLFDYGDVDGPAYKARLQHPLGLVYKDGLLYVADTYNSKIKILDPIEKTSRTLAGTGESGYTDGPADKAQFNEPGAIATLGNKLYIADVNNHQIRVLDLVSNDVSTLQLTHLEKLQHRAMANFTGRLIELKEQPLRAGTSRIVLNFALPRGYHFTAEAPYYLTWRSNDNAVVRFESNGDGSNFDASSLPVELAVEAEPGMTELTFDGVLYFCRDNSTVCEVDNFRAKVLVTVTDRGSDRVVVTVQAETAPM